MRVLLLQLDGKLPNIALMRLAAHHRERGDTVEFRRIRQYVHRGLFQKRADRVYASAIFTRSLGRLELVRQEWPDVIAGGTAFDKIDDAGRYVADTRTIESECGVHTTFQDYSLYPQFQQSIGFTQRGCRLNCWFCGVHQKEGNVRFEQTIHQLWRGAPYPRELHLLDNDFFGQNSWKDRIQEIREGQFKVSFTQGINARFLTDDAAVAIASIPYYDDGFRFRRLYTAWDSLGDEEKLFDGLKLLVHYGVARSHLMVYMLIGGRGDTHETRDYRRRRLREFGALPYPMPYLRSPELVGFQRWVLTHADKALSWDEWQRSHYQIRPQRGSPMFDETTTS